MTADGGVLPAVAAARLEATIAQAVERARLGGRETVAATTFTLPADTDPTAIVCASRRGGEPWFCLEQTGEARSLATLGSVRTLTTSGRGRFARVATAWRELVASAVCEAPQGPRGAGLIACGGFAFSPDGGSTPAWAGYPPARLEVPEVALAREGDDVRMTLAALARPGDRSDDLVARVRARVARLRAAPLPLLDPDPARVARVSGPAPPEHYEGAVARAVERIRAAELEKIVLAREVDVHAPRPHDPAAVLGVLRDAFPDCYVFAAGTGDAAFVAASPELLVRRAGLRASTVALAGSIRRSADPAVDAHLGEQLLRSAKDREEQEIVARRIERTLERHALWVTRPSEPSIVQVANIQHLGTPIRAQLAAPVGAIELAGLLHPTPAVGAEPADPGLRVIPELEGLDRGWYAGPVGWVDASEDGEFCVALRSALLRGPVARLYAGVGVVRDSRPDAELAETELKLAALLPVLAG